MVTTAYRSVHFMRRLGYLAEVVEHRQGRFVRKDLFNVADVISVHPVRKEIILIQAYQYKDRNAPNHVCLTAEHPIIDKILRAGGKFEKHEWHVTRKHGKRYWSVERKSIC